MFEDQELPGTGNKARKPRKQQIRANALIIKEYIILEWGLAIKEGGIYLQSRTLVAKAIPGYGAFNSGNKGFHENWKRIYKHLREMFDIEGFIIVAVNRSIERRMVDRTKIILDDAGNKHEEIEDDLVPSGFKHGRRIPEDNCQFNQEFRNSSCRGRLTSFVIFPKNRQHWLIGYSDNRREERDTNCTLNGRRITDRHNSLGGLTDGQHKTIREPNHKRLLDYENSYPLFPDDSKPDAIS